MTGIIARQISGARNVVLGEVREQTWTTVDATYDGVRQLDQIGQHTLTREVHLAYLAECEAWAEQQRGEGFTVRWPPAQAACGYYGPTDANGNCWFVHAEKALEP